MSPTAIIELQRRLTVVGEIRIGGEKKPKAPGAKLRAFRLTSASKPLIEQASALYGGDVTPWESPNGQKWQVYTEANELPVLVMPDYSLSQTYELWEGATKRERVCFGDGYDELISGKPCLCQSENVQRCDIYTRITIALLELETAQGWRLITRGANAAHELPTMMRLIERVGGGSTFVPARLRVDERRGVKDGQVVRYVVPSLDLDRGYAALAAGAPKQLVSSAESDAETLEQQSESAKTFAVEAAVGGGSERPAQIESRAAEFGPFTPPPSAPGFAHASAPDLELKPNPPALPDDEQSTLDLIKSTFDATEIVDEQPKTRAKPDKPTEKMKTKLNVLVAKLSEGGHIEKESLYDAVATRLRHVGKRDLVMSLEGSIDADGVYHWAPLRDALSRAEANTLIDWLEKKQAQVTA